MCGRVSFWLWREIVLIMRTPFDFLWAVSTKKSCWVTLLWSASQCVYFVRSNTLLLFISLFCIFLLYLTDPQVKVRNNSLAKVCFTWDQNFLLLSISFLYCIHLQTYSQNRFSKILITFCASRNWWIIIVFLQCLLKEKLPIFMVNSLLLHIPLLALTDPQTEWQRNKYTCCTWAGGTFFPVVLFCKFFDSGGNRFYCFLRT